MHVKPDGHEHTAPADLEHAFAYYERACDAGNANACTAVGMFFQAGRGGAARDGTKAFLFYKQACDAKDANACLRIAQMYTSGTVLQQDDAKAAAYRKSACDLGAQAGCR